MQLPLSWRGIVLEGARAARWEGYRMQQTRRFGSGRLAALLLGLSTIASAIAPQAASQETEILARYPAPSPDGSQIVFSYQGDLWLVPAEGGEARRLTAHPAYDGRAIWSPDGRWIAFPSDRDGNVDVFALPLEGGEIRRLTWHSDNDYPTDWTPDGKGILFQSRRGILDDGTWGTFVVPLAGGTPFALLPTGARVARLSPDGRRLAYMRGGSSWWRRGYEGNARWRIWVSDLDSPLLGTGDWPWLAASAARERILSTAAEAGPQTTPGLHAPTGLRLAAHDLNASELGHELPERWEDPYGRNWLENWDRGVDLSRPQIETGSNAYPQWFPDGEHLLYLSESGGTSNLKILSLSSGSRAFLTRYTGGRLRIPKLSRNGRLVTFEYEDGIYALDIPAQLPPPGSSAWPQAPPAPRRLAIEIPRDQIAPTLKRVPVSSGADAYALSPDGKQTAIVFGGDLFVMKTSQEEPAAYQVTDYAGRDGQPAWMADSRSLVFVSDRDGNRNLYRIAPADTSEPLLARALKHEIEQLTDDRREEWRPKVSPDGQQIAYLRGAGTLMVMRADGSDARVLLENTLDIEFEWSPDSRWLMYAVEDNDFNTDVWIVSADGETGPHNISRHPDDDYSPVWSADGRMVAFASSRAFPGETDIWYVWLTRADEETARIDRLAEFSDRRSAAEAGAAGRWRTRTSRAAATAAGADRDPWSDEADEEAEVGGDDAEDEDTAEEVVVEIDFEGIHERLHRLTTFPGRESRVLIAKDGSEFVFTSNTDGKTDLWKIAWDGDDPERLTQGGQEPRHLQWGPKRKEIYFLKEGGRIASVPLAGGKTTSYGFESEMAIDLPARRVAAFTEGWRRLRDAFYDSEFHGTDWEAMLRHYRPWARKASTFEDYQDVLKMMLGELNSSHCGTWGGGERGAPGAEQGRGAAVSDFLEAAASVGDFLLAPDFGARGASEAHGSPLSAQTGDLGVLFDPTHHGAGLRIAHVVEGTAAERVESRLEAGEVIRTVDGTAVNAAMNWARLMDRSVERKTLLEVEDRDGELREVVITPHSAWRTRWKIYEEAVALRRDYVHAQSDGRVAYVHIEGMDVESLERYERDLYAEAHGREALIIDVRDNGGGWTTDLMLTSLMAADHATTIPRGGGPGYPEDRRLLYAWTKPVVVLCDEHSFSNAEIFSWAIKTLGRGPIVGQRTHGGVISTGGTHMVDGAWIRLPFRGWWSKLDGSPLEGTGCVPDHPVRNPPGEVVRGTDRQLQTALELAIEQID
ncbi:MAG: hypothetical protein GF330_06255 [Candidatus Eisenbacteria bacterium]|nr:hypothetical protein [Candidatus Eisenbacteria bacterium]